MKSSNVASLITLAGLTAQSVGVYLSFGAGASLIVSGTEVAIVGILAVMSHVGVRNA